MDLMEGNCDIPLIWNRVCNVFDCLLHSVFDLFCSGRWGDGRGGTGMSYVSVRVWRQKWYTQKRWYFEVSFQRFGGFWANVLCLFKLSFFVGTQWEADWFRWKAMLFWIEQKQCYMWLLCLSKWQFSTSLYLEIKNCSENCVFFNSWNLKLKIDLIVFILISGKKNNDSRTTIKRVWIKVRQSSFYLEITIIITWFPISNGWCL